MAAIGEDALGPTKADYAQGKRFFGTFAAVRLLTAAAARRTVINNTISGPAYGYDLRLFLKYADTTAARGTHAPKRTVLEKVF